MTPTNNDFKLRHQTLTEALWHKVQIFSLCFDASSFKFHSKHSFKEITLFLNNIFSSSHVHMFMKNSDFEFLIWKGNNVITESKYTCKSDFVVLLTV